MCAHNLHAWTYHTLFTLLPRKCCDVQNVLCTAKHTRARTNTVVGSDSAPSRMYVCVCVCVCIRVSTGAKHALKDRHSYLHFLFEYLALIHGCFAILYQSTVQCAHQKGVSLVL